MQRIGPDHDQMSFMKDEQNGLEKYSREDGQPETGISTLMAHMCRVIYFSLGVVRDV